LDIREGLYEAGAALERSEVDGLVIFTSTATHAQSARSFG
jgi:hypothetical protein